MYLVKKKKVFTVTICSLSSPMKCVVNLITGVEAVEAKAVLM